MSKNKVAVVQWTAKLMDKSDNLLQIRKWSADAARQGAKLVVFPECSNSGYIYASKEEAEQAADLLDSDWVRGIKDIALSHEIYLAVGFTEKDQLTGFIYNSVLCISPDGEVAAVYRKHFLVSFDHHFFNPGNQGFPYVDSKLGRMGFLICGDARIPELARNNGLNKVDILIYPTAWGSRDQLEINVKARGIENGFWILAADKVGVERGFSYPGRSFIMAPDGTIVAEAGEAEEELLIGEVDIPLSRLFNPIRHPKLYENLLKKVPEERPKDSYFHPAVLHIHSNEIREIEERILEARMLGAQCCYILMQDNSEEVSSALESLAEITGMVLIVSSHYHNQAAVYLPSIGRQVQVELHHKENGSSWKLYEAARVKLGLLIRSDGVIPEMARCMAFDGASLVFWLQTSPYSEAQKLLAKARAIENQMYVIVVYQETGYAVAISPDGSELWNPPYQEGAILHWHLPLSRAAGGESLPMTDILKDRPYSAIRRLVD